MNKYTINAAVDIGYERENQEDFVEFKELDDKNLLCVIADGTGSRKNYPQPAVIAVMDITDNLQNLFNNKKDVFLDDPSYFLKEAMLRANTVLGAFKMGNEEIYSGYAASVTCCLLTENDKFYIAHAGNTRVYLLRDGQIMQMTRDQTKAQDLVEDGKIDIETYHVHPDRLKMTSGIGVILDPEIQTFSSKMKDNDLIFLSSDGIHYAIQPEAIKQIILESQSADIATANLIDAAKNIIKYPDNMSAIIITKNGGE